MSHPHEFVVIVVVVVVVDVVVIVDVVDVVVVVNVDVVDVVVVVNVDVVDSVVNVVVVTVFKCVADSVECMVVDVVERNIRKIIAIVAAEVFFGGAEGAENAIIKVVVVEDGVTDGDVSHGGVRLEHTAAHRTARGVAIINLLVISVVTVVAIFRVEGGAVGKVG